MEAQEYINSKARRKKKRFPQYKISYLLHYKQVKINVFVHTHADKERNRELYMQMDIHVMDTQTVDYY